MNQNSVYKRPKTIYWQYLLVIHLWGIIIELLYQNILNICIVFLEMRL
jgi:hypothetical protein